MEGGLPSGHDGVFAVVNDDRMAEIFRMKKNKYSGGYPDTLPTSGILYDHSPAILAALSINPVVSGILEAQVIAQHRYNVRPGRALSHVTPSAALRAAVVPDSFH